MSENTTPNLQPEVSLPIAPTIGEIDHFRIINKNGQSQKASITQVRELMGIDYSKLEEQIVHGEFAMNYKGDRCQVYVRGILVAVTVVAGQVPLLGFRQNIGITGLVSSNIEAYSKATVSPIYRGDADRTVLTPEPEDGIVNINIRGYAIDELVAGSTIHVSGYIKYTK